MKNNIDKFKILYNEKLYKAVLIFIFDDINQKFLSNVIIAEIKLIGLDNITDFSYVFCNVADVVFTPGLKKLDTSKVTDMSYIFYKSNPNIFKEISNWNLSNVTNIEYMFYYLLKG